MFGIRELFDQLVSGLLLVQDGFGSANNLQITILNQLESSYYVPKHNYQLKLDFSSENT